MYTISFVFKHKAIDVMTIGLVKWFNPDKGFGVIGNPDEGEFFVHINNFINVPQSIPKGTAIIFKKRFDNKKNRNTAGNCRVIGELEDWEIALNYLGKQDNVNIEVEITDQGKRGNPYHRKEIQSFSLINLAAKQFLKDKNENEVLNVIIDYFDNGLNEQLFIPYCEFIEKRITKRFPAENATALLKAIFTHFGNNLNEDILFQVWKNKRFKFISYTDAEDYEIPKNVLKNFANEISVSDLKRIKDFSFGSEFCKEFVTAKFSNINRLQTDDFKSLYPFLEFTSEEERAKYNTELNSLYTQKITAEIIEKANRLELIQSHKDFQNYNRLLSQHIPNEISNEEKSQIKNEIERIVISKCLEEFKPELWIKGIIDSAPFEFIILTFLADSTQNDKRTVILSKLHLNQQLELLKRYSGDNSFERAFQSLENLVEEENSIGYDFELSKKLFDAEFWTDKKHSDLIRLFSQHVNDKSSNDKKYELFFKGFIKDVPRNLVKQNIDKLNEDDCRKIFDSLPEDQDYILEILQCKFSTKNISSLDRLYDLAKQYLNAERFNLFDEQIFATIDKTEYFKLWGKGKAKIFPNEYIEELLNDDYRNYKEIEKWIANRVISIEAMANFLLSYLSQQIPVTDRIIFHKQFNHIKFLLQTEELHLEKIKGLKNSFYNIILWFLGMQNALDFDLLKAKFIYFAPDEQVKIVRKLFSLKANGLFELTIEKLNELTRFDLDLYETNLNFNPAIPIDISTDVIIKALSHYKQHQIFFVQSDLLTIILHDLKRDKSMRFRLSNYFERCLGRQTPKYNWSTEGKVKKVAFGNNQFYFAISFSTGETRERGGRKVFTANTNFENLKEAVKKLPGAKWNPNEKHWGVPSRYETDVLNFAKKQRFFLDFEGSNYANNIHLAEYKRENIPNGISFCEGRLANRPDETYKKQFWWCAGQKCFEKCEHIHSSEEWENYTLLDFCEILGLNTDETNRSGDFIPKGHYYKFIALINSFNRLLEKLYCCDCNQILYPVETGHFAAHAVVRFHCVNNNCSNNDEIYLNHCLNGQCNAIIDSRVSKKCSNGLFICDNCGSCCSHEMLSRRLANLQTAGGHIYPNAKRCIDEKLGHLERGEYFCFKCQNAMDEVRVDIFHCGHCDVTYDTTKYKFKRPHKHLKTNRTDMPNDDLFFF